MENNWLIPLIAGIAGALIGTYGGSFFLSKFQDIKIKKVRNLAIKALKIIKDYAKTDNTYDKVSEQFNNDLTTSEKRAILVSLHKLGVPVEIPAKDIFNINKICFLSKLIDKVEVEGMIHQVEKGHCDHLLFLDVDSYFSSNIRVNSIRNIGKKFVTEVLAKSKLNREKEIIEFPENWTNNFTRGEIATVLVFKGKLMTDEYFDIHGSIDNTKIAELVKEIELGIWDSYLFWEFEAYQNVISQTKLADTVSYQMMSQQQNVVTINTNEPSVEENK